MTVETETALIKLLEKIEQKLDKFIETTNQKFDNIQKDLTDLKVGQAKLEGKVETLDVKIENLQKGQNKLESEQKDTKNEVSGLYKWVIVLIVTSVLSLGNIFLRIFDFFSKTT